MKITAQDLIDNFDIKVINKDVADTSRYVSSPTINRTGLQLGGMPVKDYYKSTIFGWGTKEKYFFDSLSKEQLQKTLENTLSEVTPALVLSHKYDGELEELIVKEASKKKIPVVKLKTRLGDIAAPLSSWITENTDIVESIHGSLVIINGVGVLITGSSGIGKSEAVLELLHNNHVFVSDDTVEIHRVGRYIYGHPSDLTKDLLEARGIGLVNIPLIYGQKSVAIRSRVELVVELVPEENLNDVDRLGNNELFNEYKALKIPRIQIPTGPGRSISVLIEAATNVYIAKKSGMDPLKLIQERSRKERK